MKKQLGIALTFLLSINLQAQTIVVWVHGTVPAIIPRKILHEKKPFKNKIFDYFPYQPIGDKGLILVGKQLPTKVGSFIVNHF